MLEEAMTNQRIPEHKKLFVFPMRYNSIITESISSY
jgi:hypothetical protein